MLILGRGLGPRKLIGGAAPSYLNSVLASTVCDLDVTVAASYPGTGTTWANLVAAPADGASQTDYDFRTGDGATSSTYPAFNGTAGSASAYWSLDTGDYFGLKSGTNTSFLAGLHKTTGGADFWMAVAYRHVANSAYQYPFATTANVASSIGLALETTNSNLFRIRQRGGSSTVIGSSAVTASNGTDYLVIASHSHSANQTRFWINSLSNVQVSHSFNTTTTDATLAAQAGKGNTNMADGTRIYSLALGNEYLDNTKAAAIIAHMEARHGRDYTS